MSPSSTGGMETEQLQQLKNDNKMKTSEMREYGGKKWQISAWISFTCWGKMRLWIIHPNGECAALLFIYFCRFARMPGPLMSTGCVHWYVSMWETLILPPSSQSRPPRRTLCPFASTFHSPFVTGYCFFVVLGGFFSGLGVKITRQNEEKMNSEAL